MEVTVIWATKVGEVVVHVLCVLDHGVSFPGYFSHARGLVDCPRGVVSVYTVLFVFAMSECCFAWG